ncbi:MAG: hypothetical protein U9N87_10030 [Planctomycetota bacterium]|nr:hypothetical protein [Planctomycetota bacterium]
MIRRYLTICFLFAAISFIPQLSDTAQARPGQYPMRYSMQAQARRDATIRRMPLMQRPNRPGHFIGNTIRNSARRSRGRW